MPPKKKQDSKKSKTAKKQTVLQKSVGSCNARGPGPQYKLKPLVGYNDHCTSRLRNPAYSIAARQNAGACSVGPGPIYYVELPKGHGFTIGEALRGTPCGGGPGPYMLPDPKPTPAFSIKWRTEQRCGGTSAGPYNLPSELNGPAFTIGKRLASDGCVGGPGPVGRYPLDTVKPRAPAYSLGLRFTDSGKCGGPGPYDPYEPPKVPAYSFGVKHGPCTAPLITDCDEVC